MGIKGLFKHLFHYLILATAVLALSACGGGESSSSGEPRIDRQEAEATNLVFVDAQLAGCVEDLIYSQGYTLVEQITELTCNGQQIESQIKDIEGIENLFNLQILDLSNNQITDVTPIAQLKNLKQLNLQNNQLEIAAVLTESESLEQVDLTDNDQLLCIEQDALTTKYGEGLKNPETCGSGDTTIVQAFADTELLSCVQQTVQHIKAEKEIDILYPQQLQQLECINQNINSIAGIENLVNLRELSLSQNAIDNIGLLQGLTKLKRVLLSKNQITDIQPLISSVNMQELRLDSNPLTDTGLIPIQNLRALQLLHISNTDVRDLSPLNQLTELLELRANNNRIIDLDPLSLLTKLSSLWVENNQIAKLDTIEQLPSLVHLVISNNWVTDLTPLQNSDKLRWLHLDGTEVQDLTPLSSLTELKWLQLNNTRVEDIQEIYSLTELDWLHLKGNNSIPCEQLDRMEIILTPERIERPDVESCDQTPQPQNTPISTIEFQDQELRDCVYDAAKKQGAIDTDQLTSLSCSIEEYGEITDITGLEQLPELQTINLIEHNDIACTQLDDLRERYSYQGEGYEGEGYEGEYYGEVALSLSENCNTAPSISAKAQQTVLAGEQTTITAQATDQDEDELIYSWQQTAGDLVQLTGESTATPNFTAPQQEQTLEFTLTVTDEHQLSTTQTISIIVTGAVLGSKENPFIVETYQDLKKVGTGIDDWNLDSYYLQIADIDASESRNEPDGKGFSPIGTEEKPFTGGYDGGSFTIDGLTINRPDESNVGLFGYAGVSSFSNINLTSIDITGLSNVAGLVGFVGAQDINKLSITLENITIQGKAIAQSHVGGLIGLGVTGDYYDVDSPIDSSFILKNIRSDISISPLDTIINFAGAVAGQLQGDGINILGSTALGSIGNDSQEYSEFNYVGGLVGFTAGRQTEILDSSSEVDIISNSFVTQTGGLIGLLAGDDVSIVNGHAIGDFNFGDGSRYIGGLVGEHRVVSNAKYRRFLISNCYALGDLVFSGSVNSTAETSGGLIGGTNSSGLTIIENSFASGNLIFEGISTSYYTGGLAGIISAEIINITNSYANGNISKLEGGHRIIGGLAGQVSGNEIEITRSYASGDIELNYVSSNEERDNYDSIGGLVGRLSGAQININNVYASGSIESNYDFNTMFSMGGLFGQLTGLGELKHAYATGDVDGGASVGGLIGYVAAGINIQNSYARGNVTGNFQVGGLVGQIQHSEANGDNPVQYSSITNSYSTGQVLLQNEELEPVDFGGLVGASTSDQNKVIESFWDVETSGMQTSAGGEPKTSDELKTTTTFTNAEWDFDETWMILSEGYTYPRLAWNTIEVDSWTDLHNMRNNMHANYVLTKNLTTYDDDYADLAGPDANNGEGWEPVGTDENPFMGTFDGGGFTIEGLTINRPEENFVGLFGYSQDTVFTNIDLEDVNLKGVGYSGGLVGGMFGDENVILNSHITGYLEPGEVGAGGVVGYMACGLANIIDSSFEGILVGVNTYAGGFIGYASGVELEILNSHSSGVVQTDGFADDVGGFAGRINGGYVSIINSYSLSDVDVYGSSEVGGFAGVIGGDSMIRMLEIIDSYSSGDITVVSGDYAVGGFAGATAAGLHVMRNSSSTSDINIAEEGNIVGGFIAISSGSYDVDGVYSTSNITLESGSLSQTGGLFGILSGGGTINRAHSSGNISSPDGRTVGGLIGRLDGMNVSNTFTTGDVDVETGSAIGGLIGVVSAETSVIENSYSSGLVSGLENVGGLIGNNEKDAVVTNSFWDIETSGQEFSAGGIGKTTAEMQSQDTFVEWDFDSTWDYVDGEYPFLQDKDIEIVRTKFESGQYQGMYSWDCGDGVNYGSADIVLNLISSFGGTITGTAEYLGATIDIQRGIYSDITGYLAFSIPASDTTADNYFVGTYNPENPASIISGSTPYGETDDLEGCSNDLGTAGTITVY